MLGSKLSDWATPMMESNNGFFTILSPVLSNGAWLTGGSATTTKPALLIEPLGTTSNNWTTLGTGIGVNAIASFTGFLMDLQLAAASKFSVTSAGAGTFASTVSATGLAATSSSNNIFISLLSQNSSAQGGQYQLGAVNGAMRVGLGGGSAASTLAASTSYSTVIISNISNVSLASSGTHAVIAALAVKNPALTVAAGGTTLFAGIYFEGTATGYTTAGPTHGIYDLFLKQAATTTLSGASTKNPSIFGFTGGSHTGLLASVECVDLDFNFKTQIGGGSRTIQFATGALTNQRTILIQEATYAFVGASTITNAATLYVAAAPTAGTNATITNAYALWIDAGTSRFDGRIQQTQGADIASASTITLGGDGNVFEITGTTNIDLISSVGWANGAIITLIFNDTLTVNDGTATSGTNITLRLAGNFNATVDDVLTLCLSENTANGVAWREVCRSVN